MVIAFSPIIETVLVLLSQSTFAPNASATNLAGNIVLSFTITGATSFTTLSPNTIAFLLPTVSIISLFSSGLVVSFSTLGRVYDEPPVVGI